jgi:hypothetical protein
VGLKKEVEMGVEVGIAWSHCGDNWLLLLIALFSHRCRHLVLVPLKI